MSPDITFRPVTRTDLPMLRDWLSHPHVRRWWGPPDDGIAAIATDLPPRAPCESAFDMWIAAGADKPFAYLQDSPAALADEVHYADMPPGARTVDLLIGPPSHLGRGLAAPLLTAFAHHASLRGATGPLLDPDPDNAPAVAAYRRAGSAEVARHDAPDGAVIVMAFPIDENAPRPIILS